MTLHEFLNFPHSLPTSTLIGITVFFILAYSFYFWLRSPRGTRWLLGPKQYEEYMRKKALEQ
ncbi:MAG: hypothetical protein LBT73_00795 [Tannerellaceae bacterium]|nr:hypothetical protein [Tannerellaceae bacterium]